MKKYIDPNLVKIAQEQDVFDILSRDGVPMVYSNHTYRHRLHDSLVITPKKGFYWFSRQTGSKSPIDYYMLVEGMEFTEATEKVLKVMNYNFDKKDIVIQNEPSKETSHIIQDFSLPEKAEHNRNVYAYLTKTRGLDRELITEMINKGLIYQDKEYNNAVFVGKDYDGNIVSAFKRITLSNPKSTSFSKGDVAGSKKEFRFRIENPSNKTVNVFEAEIDMLSYISMQPKIARNENYIALGGVSDKALLEFLDHRNVENINVCSDNDAAGHRFCKEIADKLGDKYYITREIPRCKDFNQDLVKGIPYKRNRIDVVTFEDSTVRMSKKEKLELINNIFKDTYQGQEVNIDYQIKNPVINRDTRIHFRWKAKQETKKSYDQRLNLGVEKNLITFLENSVVIGTDQEKKPEQNQMHSNTGRWIYLSKDIIIDGELYRLKTDIREGQNNRTFIYSMKLQEYEITMPNKLSAKERQHAAIKQDQEHDPIQKNLDVTFRSKDDIVF